METKVVHKIKVYSSTCFTYFTSHTCMKGLLSFCLYLRTRVTFLVDTVVVVARTFQTGSSV